MRSHSTLGLILFSLLAPHAAHDAGAQTLSATYTTYISGRAAVTEVFTLSTDNDGIRIEGEIAAGGAKQKVTSTGTAGSMSFAVEAGSTRLMSAEIAGGRMKVSLPGQPEKESSTRAKLIMENLVWHQYIFLIRQYDRTRGGLQEIPVLLPSQALEIDTRIERTAGITAAGVEADHFRISSASGPVIDVWADESSVPLLILVEVQNVKVVRQGHETFAESVIATRLGEHAAPPPYADPAAFREEEVSFGIKGWELPGVLTLPIGDGTFPSVVLVHGSGPNDRDETIGPNKPFRDLAWGLASRGIAVLRYDKRTKVHGARLGAMKERFTVKDEVIDDALEGVTLLRNHPRIDAKRILILGHSLGGMLIPRIAAGDANVAGFIVLAGATRPLEDLMLIQTRYIASLDGTIADAEKAQIEKLEAGVARIKALGEGDAASTENILGAPPSYWLDLRSSDPVEAALRIDRPMLILQGERDYQVTMEDYVRWKPLSSRPNVTLKVYPKLNHLFMEGEGRSAPAEYGRKSNVASYVIDDIVGWIGQLK